MNPSVPVQLPHEIQDAIPYSPALWETWWFWGIVAGLIMVGIAYYIFSLRSKTNEVVEEESRPLTLTEKIESLVTAIERLQLGHESRQWKQAYALHSLHLRGALELFTGVPFTDMTVKEISQKMESITFLTHGERVSVLEVLRHAEAVLYADKAAEEAVFNDEKRATISHIKALLNRKLAQEVEQQEGAL